MKGSWESAPRWRWRDFRREPLVHLVNGWCSTICWLVGHKADPPVQAFGGKTVSYVLSNGRILTACLRCGAGKRPLVLR